MKKSRLLGATCTCVTDAVAICLVLLLLSGCVAHIPMEEQSPDLSYYHEGTIMVSVVDERKHARPDLEADVIGRVHGVFGIPSKMKVYPWFEVDSDKKENTLAQALEDRIVFGLNDEGWNAISASYEQHPSEQEIHNSLQNEKAQNLMLLILEDWYVSINLNLVSAFNFDWDVNLKIFDSKADLLLQKTTAGRDVVDEEANESYNNHIRRAFRDRLVKIFEAQEVQDALAYGVPILTGENVIDKLERLQQLRTSGDLTTEEYEVLKAAVISAEVPVTEKPVIRH